MSQLGPPASGTTIHLLTDLHIDLPGRATRVESLLHDLDNIPDDATHVDARVIAGDIIHNLNPGDAPGQINRAKQVLDRLASGGTPNIVALGNHDVFCGLTGDPVIQAYGASQWRNYTAIRAGIKFIIYGPTNQAETGIDNGGPNTTDWVVPQWVRLWIEQQIDNSALPVILVTHCSPAEAFGTDQIGFYLQPTSWVSSVIADPKVIAWLHGHKHRWYNSPDWFGTVNGTLLVNGGACGGTLPDDQVQTGHPVQASRTNGSVYLTWFNPGWEIRVRDHSTMTWGTRSTGYSHEWSAQ